MGKASRDKGNRREREIVNALREAGIPARRVPLSGQLHSFKGDIEFLPYAHPVAAAFNESDWRDRAGAAMKAECKARKQFPKWLLEWLGDNDALFLVEDRKEPLVVLPFSIFREIVG